MDLRRTFFALLMTTAFLPQGRTSNLGEQNETALARASHQSPTLCLEMFLFHVNGLFQKAASPEEKKAIISHVVNAERVARFTPQDALLPLSDLSAHTCESAMICVDNAGQPYLNIHKTTPLSLAVTMGKPALVDPWLSVIDDVNSDLFATWGYRQPFSLAHHGLDPEHPMYNEQATLEDRLAVLDLLAAKGADFNAMFKESLYDNPPLAAGDPRGWGGAHEVGQDALRARALLHGANPLLGGTSYAARGSAYKLKGPLVGTLFAQDKALSLGGAALMDALAKRHPIVTYTLARAYLKERDLPTATLYARAAAEQGVTKANHIYGALVSQGHHKPASLFTSILDMVPFYQKWRLSFYRDEAISWLEKGHGTLSDDTLVHDPMLRGLYERNLEEGRATPGQLLALGDYYRKTPSTAYTNHRVMALGCFMATTKHHNATQEEQANAHLKLGQLYNAPYLEVLTPGHFFTVRERDKARLHLEQAVSLGSQSAQCHLTALDLEQCLSPHHPIFQNMTYFESTSVAFPLSPTPLSLEGMHGGFLGAGS